METKNTELKKTLVIKNYYSDDDEISAKMAEQIIEDNREYIVWADGTPITAEEIQRNFYIIIKGYNISLAHKKVDFYIEDISSHFFAKVYIKNKNIELYNDDAHTKIYQGLGALNSPWEIWEKLAYEDGLAERYAIVEITFVP